MSTAKNEQQAELEDYAHHVVRLMGDFARQEWNFPPNWSIETFVRFTPPKKLQTGQLKNKSSWGGLHLSRKIGVGLVPFVILQLRWIATINLKQPAQFTEYDHIKNDADIGAFYFSDWRKYVTALCAHKVAHAVQHSAKKFVTQENNWLANSSHSLKDTLGHGAFWQEIYRKLRIAFVNLAEVLPVKPDGEVTRRQKNRFARKTML